MDEGNDKLRHLFRKVDDAFQDLMASPYSSDSNQAYLDARKELHDYMQSLRGVFPDSENHYHDV